MVKEAGEFMGVKIYVYSKGISGFFERLWNDLKYNTVYVPEPPKNQGSFSYLRLNAGHLLLKERTWYKWIRDLETKARKRQ